MVATNSKAAGLEVNSVPGPPHSGPLESVPATVPPPRIDERLIFLLGLPRSGTTLYQSLLTRHQEVYSQAEPWLLLAPLLSMQDGEITAPRYSTSLAYRGLQCLLESCEEGDEAYYRAVRTMTVELYGASLASTGKTYFLDKTPRYYMIMEPLLRTFPDAKFLLLLRDPLWILASIAQSWCKGECANVLSHPYHRPTILEGPRAIADNLDTVRSRGFVTRYEDLVVQPEREINATCDFLKLQFDESMLTYNPAELERRPLGDRWGITKHSAPVQTSLAIPKVLKTRRNKQLAIEYMQFLGRDLYVRLGYDFDETMTALMASEVAQESHASQMKAKLRPTYRAVKAGLQAMRQEWRMHQSFRDVRTGKREHV